MPAAAATPLVPHQPLSTMTTSAPDSRAEIADHAAAGPPPRTRTSAVVEAAGAGDRGTGGPQGTARRRGGRQTGARRGGGRQREPGVPGLSERKGEREVRRSTTGRAGDPEQVHVAAPAER